MVEGLFSGTLDLTRGRKKREEITVSRPPINLMSNDSVDYPSWLPRRPPPPGPQSTIQSSILTDIHQDDDGELDLSGFKRPTPRSVRIVNLPPKVKVRTGGPPTTVDDPLSVPPLPLPQPRFNAKNLHIQLLRSPSRWMKSYYYLWPFLIFYHLPLQSFFDFNAVYILLLYVSPFLSFAFS